MYMPQTFVSFISWISWKSFFWSMHTWTEKKNAWRERERIRGEIMWNEDGKIKKGKWKEKGERRTKIEMKRKKSWNVLIVFIEYLLIKMSRTELTRFSFYILFSKFCRILYSSCQVILAFNIMVCNNIVKEILLQKFEIHMEYIQNI